MLAWLRRELNGLGTYIITYAKESQVEHAMDRI